MQYKNFIGIDVSKLQLDLSLIITEQECTYLGKCKNEVSSIEVHLKKLIKSKKLVPSETLICAEYTGQYTYPLCCVC